MKKLALIITSLLIISMSFAQVPTAEKEALIALFNDTNGEDWTTNTNWNTDTAVTDWYGITVETIEGNDHITKVILSNNNLEGTLPSSLNNLTNLNQFYVQSNLLTGNVPNLTEINSLERLMIRNNNYIFENFENEYNTYVSNLGAFFGYEPMNKTDEEEIANLVVGQNYSFSMSSVDGENTNYQWYKNGEIINGETNITLNINNAQISDAANYTCKANHSIITDLTLEREVAHLYGEINATDRAVLVALYDATDGDNWTTNTNWNSSEPVYTWHGITMVGTRVTQISLYTNNLVGTIPNDLGDLIYLTSIGFNNNTLSGNIPTNLSNCINLKELSVANNQLTGNIPMEFANLSKIWIFNVYGNQLSGDFPDILASWPNLYFISIGYYGSSNDFTGTIDLNNNPNLGICWLSNNNLSTVKIQNGTNASVFFLAKNNPNLTCVYVDDVTFSTTNWTNNIDANTTFVETYEDCVAVGAVSDTYFSMLKVYPNPATETINIESSIAIKQIEIYNYQGKLVLATKKTKIDVSKFTSGVYLIKAKTVDNRSLLQKIVVN